MGDCCFMYSLKVGTRLALKIQRSSLELESNEARDNQACLCRLSHASGYVRQHWSKQFMGTPELCRQHHATCQSHYMLQLHTDDNRRQLPRQQPVCKPSSLQALRRISRCALPKSHATIPWFWQGVENHGACLRAANAQPSPINLFRWRPQFVSNSS